MTATKNTALERVSKNLVPTEPLQKIEQLRHEFERLSTQANLVTPVSSIDAIPQMHGISLRAVSIDSKVDRFGNGSEVYRDKRFCEENERALSGTGLAKIAAAAGVQIVERKRNDDRRDPNYCEVEITIGMRDYDGTWRQMTKAREVDLRDGAPEAMKPEKIQKPGDKYPQKTGNLVPLDPSALADKRRHIQSLAETKAFHRALKKLLTLREKYTVDELKKPFVVPKLVPALDPSDPDQKRALIEMAVGREASLYGGAVGEMRELKDATPASTLSANAGAVEVDVDEEEEPADDFVPIDFPDEPEEVIHVCVCVCSCQVEISAEVAEKTTELTGRPLCRECFPGKGFNAQKHEDVGDLMLKMYPGLSARRVIQGLGKGGA